MTFKVLQMAKAVATKDKDTVRKDALSGMIDAIQKASITPKGRIEITDQLVADTLIKYQKTIQEMIDSCPADRTELMERYIAEMGVVKQYAPQLITDPEKIKNTIRITLDTFGIEANKQNKGKVMKAIMPHVKGKADMKVVNQVVAEMLE